MKDRIALSITSVLSILLFVIILLASIVAAGIPVLHLRAVGLAGGKFNNPSGVFFWIWTLLALGVTATFSVILSARALWSRRRSPAPRSS